MAHNTDTDSRCCKTNKNQSLVPKKTVSIAVLKLFTVSNVTLQTVPDATNARFFKFHLSPLN